MPHRAAGLWACDPKTAARAPTARAAFRARLRSGGIYQQDVVSAVGPSYSNSGRQRCMRVAPSEQ